MARVTVVLAVEPRQFPFGTQAGPIRVTIAKEGESLFLEGDGPEFVFEDVAVGDWVATAQRLNSGGQGLGDALTQAFTVTPTTVDITVPVSMTVSMG